MEKVLIVTGGSRGIGAATAKAAGEAGYNVIVNYNRRRDEAETVVRVICSRGANAAAVQADVSIEDDVFRLFSETENRFGRVDSLVNSAGVMGKFGQFAQLADADLRRVFAVNVFGSALCAREAVKQMAKSRGGRGGAIVNLSSVAAELGSPGECVHYAATKGAINSLTIGLAKEVAREGIRVNAIEPGMVDTDMQLASGDPGRVARIIPTVPLARCASPEEIAGPIIFLLSEAASYVTGAIVRVSGGR